MMISLRARGRRHGGVPRRVVEHPGFAEDVARAETGDVLAVAG